ncbi:MAG TPA: DUF3313 domain-containing protein [Syntrophorhabdaceae bacterium]|nr:DUF3313 domain-containing protein [Syntrophorhabdaceae bacterium]
MKIIKAVLAVMTGFGLVASGAFAGGQEFSGFLTGYYQDLKPEPGGGHRMHWLKPGTVLVKYDKVMVDPIVFSSTDRSDYEAIDPEQMNELLDNFRKTIVTALRDQYTVVADPGDGVARIRIALTGIEPSNPAISAFTSITPTGFVLSLIKRGATGSWVGSGSTKLEAKVLDSVTDEVILAAADKSTASFRERFSQWGSAHNAFKSWAQWTVKLLAGVRETKGPVLALRP